MNCPVCHYEYDEEYKENQLVVLKGDEPFIDIYTDAKMVIKNPKECGYGDYDYSSKIEVILIACPKCKSVMLNSETD